MRIPSLLMFILISIGTVYGEGHFDYSTALVRELADTFCDSLKQENPEQPIDLELAKHQHHTYSELVCSLVTHAIYLPSDPMHPDCNFIEDTAILVGNEAVISRMGAQSRRGEEIPVMEALEDLNLSQIHRITAPATMDGGDILYTGRHLFVGQSNRTNKKGLTQLSQIFSDKLPVIPIEVEGSLHLKSTVSQLDFDTLIVSDDAEGHRVQNAIELATPFYQFISVPDRVAANVLRIGNTLIIQAGFPDSEAILRHAAEERHLEVITLEMSELIKADGALTCGSLLF